jgi:hypothetical protein
MTCMAAVVYHRLVYCNKFCTFVVHIGITTFVFLKKVFFYHKHRADSIVDEWGCCYTHTGCNMYVELNIFTYVVQS